ncbi:MAG: tetratricopeptide repeat protein [Bacteroidota bacterium]
MKFTLFAAVVVAMMIGCSEPKADAEKLNHANAMVNTGQYEEGIKALDEIAQKSPNDPALKQSLITAHVKFGHFYLFNDTLAPKVKYPNALRQYREALKLDPENKDAKENAQQIIDIYKMMGREVPNV